ncbi:DUF1648 domain-containing protein [Lacticaseibacillus jixiensis]|uniref:DUF1648 domain-containing protein n=1 Tax=Lacticaseibacillus jixiensis TaxID=3231926 RepID=UPI0036F1F3D7
MKRFRMFNYSAVAVSLVLTIIFMAMAPRVVVMHFNGTGVADSWSGRAGLLLEPVVLLVIALICDGVARSWRKRNDLKTFPMITIGEWRLLSLVGVVLIVLVALQLYQIGWLQN